MPFYISKKNRLTYNKQNEHPGLFSHEVHGQIVVVSSSAQTLNLISTTTATAAGVLCPLKEKKLLSLLLSHFPHFYFSLSTNVHDM